MAWDWQVFCEDTLERTPVQGCFGKGGDITYLDWLLSAWGWTRSVSLLALLIAFAVGYMLDGSVYTWLLPYIDPAVLLLVGLALVPLPIRTLRSAVSEMLLMTPEDLLQEVERLADEVVNEERFSGHRAYAARVGRGTQIEIYFIVPTDQPPRRLEEMDAIRDRLGAAIGGDTRQRWLTIAFTTDPARAD